MSKWIYRGSYLEEPPENALGFLYKVEEPITKAFYWGMKMFYSMTNPKISKRRAEELYSGRGKRKTKELKIKPSNWKTYCTSSKQVQEFVKDLGEHAFNWEIIDIFDNKTELQLAEVKAIIDDFCNPQCMNAWVKINIYRKNLNCQK